MEKGAHGRGKPFKKKTRRLRNIIADGLLTGLSLAFLWHFSNIWRYGQYLAKEPNILIRSLETAGLLVVFTFGVYRLVIDLRR